jgi:hypothetical protein
MDAALTLPAAADSHHGVMMNTMEKTLDIIDINNDLMLLRDGTFAMVLETSSINLDLKSEAEADVITTHYQHLLQSLVAPIQLLVRTRTVQMDEHYAILQKRIDAATNETTQALLRDYREFLAQLVKGRNMVTRKFYIVVRSTGETNLRQAKEQLHLQKEQLLRLLQPMELKATQLTSLDLAALFYASFQPGKAHLQPITPEVLVD